MPRAALREAQQNDHQMEEAANSARAVADVAGVAAAPATAEADAAITYYQVHLYRVSGRVSKDNHTSSSSSIGPLEVAGKLTIACVRCEARAELVRYSRGI